MSFYPLSLCISNLPFTDFDLRHLVEAFGYLARYVSARQTPDWEIMPYVAQSLLLLLAPAFFAASIYMILGRVIRLLNASSNSLIRPSWLTKIFVTGDVLSFLIQSGGMSFLNTSIMDKSNLYASRGWHARQSRQRIQNETG